MYLGNLSPTQSVGSPDRPTDRKVKKSEAIVAELVGPTVEALGLQLWGVEHSQQGKYSLLRIYIEHEEGISVDDCERVSRQVSAILDVEDPISGEYTLEVSSPGVDRPLFAAEQYRQHLGDMVKIKTRGPVSGRRRFKGTIEAVADDVVTVDVGGETFELPLSDIDKAHIVYQLDSQES